MTDKPLLYDGFALDVVRRFQQRFDEIRTVHNFEYGGEFEIALCKVLRSVLPSRAGICRGYVVGRDGTIAGDDIVIFDAARFPTLRALGESFEQKERVPAEGVLAYIEAKHTLVIGGDGGQSLSTAAGQAGRVKAIHRDPVGLGGAVRGLNLSSGFNFTTPPGCPTIRNPWYTAVFARHVRVDEAYRQTCDAAQRGPGETEDDYCFRAAFRALSGDSVSHLPDVIAAGDTFVCPAYLPEPPAEGGGLRCFLTPSSRHFIVPSPGVALGVATLHLMWAMEWLVLGEIPWSNVLLELTAFAQTSSQKGTSS